jgi:GDP-L-fucose synthase
VKIYIAGINGMVGRSLKDKLSENGIEIRGKSSIDLDFKNRENTFADLNDNKPDVLIIAAAKVGGIGANSLNPVGFLSENLQIQTNLLDAAHAARIPKVIFLGSSCIYPKYSPQPIKEECLLKGELEPTNEPYALAKISGLKLVQAYRRQYGHNWITAMPTNLYGPFDNFDSNNSHVLPSLMRKFHDAKINNLEFVNIWGDGTPMREFLHSTDLADAILTLIEKYDDISPVNIGSGQEISILGLAEMIKQITGFDGELHFDRTKPNGTPRKLLDLSKINKIGWYSRIPLEDGIRETYQWYLHNLDKARL